DEGTGDRGGAGAAIGFEHVAIEDDLVFPQRGHIDDGPERAPDQALDFLGATRLLAGGRLAAGAAAGGARQHAIFGCNPAQALPTPPGEQGGCDGRGHQHTRAPECNKARAFGLRSDAPLEGHIAHLIERPSAWPHKIRILVLPVWLPASQRFTGWRTTALSWRPGAFLLLS